MSPSSDAPTTAAPLAGLYRACGTIGNVGLPGVPIAHFSLLVNPSGSITGVVHITQAIQGPDSNIEFPVTGTIHELVWGSQETLVITLTGTYTYYCPPPALCIIQEKFMAHLLLDKDWNGTASFTYGNNQRIDKVPVKSSPC